MIRVQLKIMISRFEFIFAMLGCIVMSLCFFLYSLLDNESKYDANALYWGNGYTMGWSFFAVLFPFLIVLPFSSSFLEDRFFHTYQTVLLRTDKRKYLRAKYLVTFIGNAVMIIIPFLLNLIFCNIFIEHNRNTPLGSRDSDNFIRTIYGTNHLYKSSEPAMPFVKIYEKSPFVYNLLYILILAFVSGILGMLILSIAFWWRRQKLFLFLPLFLFIRIGNLCTEKSFQEAMVDGNQVFINWSLMDYLTPFTFSGKDSRVFLGFLGITFGIIIVTYLVELRREVGNE